MTSVVPRLDTALADLERDGCVVLPGVLDADAAADARQRLWAAAQESERRGSPTFLPQLDPNASNVRVFNLLDLDPVFVALIAHPVADAVVRRVLGDDYIVSNFTANIARPGSRSMAVHSDQGIVFPEPWTAPWTLNVIWCLDDVHADNGATRYLPGSHAFRTREDVPADALDQMVPFEAEAGSIVVMEGRVWHTSGANVTLDEDRALLFGYYTKPFIRPQWNFSAALSSAAQERCDPDLRRRLGLDLALNIGQV